MKVSFNSIKYGFLACVAIICLGAKYNKNFDIYLISQLQQIHPFVLLPMCLASAIFFGYCMLTGPRLVDFLQTPNR